MLGETKERRWHRHRRGKRGSRGNSCDPNKIIRGATSTSCSPNLLCKVTFTTKILENSPTSGAFTPDLICTHYTLCIPFSKNTYCTKLSFGFDCLSPIFTSPTKKSFNFCSPNRKIVPRLWTCMRFETRRCVKMRLRPGLRPRLHWGSLLCSPRPSS